MVHFHKLWFIFISPLVLNNSKLWFICLVYDKQRFILTPCLRRLGGSITLQPFLANWRLKSHLILDVMKKLYVRCTAWNPELTNKLANQFFFTPKPKELFGLQFAPCKKLYEIALMHHAGQPAHIGAKSLMRFNLSSYPFFSIWGQWQKGGVGNSCRSFSPLHLPPCFV